jgi:hypothetical protein
MRNIEICLPPEVDCGALERIIDEAIAQSGLRTVLRGSLKKFPGCIHWHVKQGGQSGTLEITLWPQQHRAWFTIQSGRAAPWIEAEIDRLADLLQDRLRGGDGTRGE